MHNKLFSVLQLLVFAFLVFSIHASAQIIEPDKEIVHQMILYLAKIESPATAHQPIYRAPQIIPTAVRQNQITKGNPDRSLSIPRLEHYAFDIINEQRVKHSLPLLKWNADMSKIAELHSENMARDKFFSHQGKDGSMVSDRAKSLFSRTWYSIGENIAFNSGFSRPVEMACQQWMSSPGHRENILDSQWTESGIGAAFSRDGTFYLTQVFIN